MSAVEIRPVRPDEALEYLRALPATAGLPWWEPAPAAWYAGRGAWPPPRPPTGEALARYAQLVSADWFRPQAAVVDGHIVGASAVLSLELTVPGPRPVALGGVTSTGVLPTHRRRGLLRGLMAAMLADCRERGEFLAGLSASEGTIYGRYGFSPASFQVRWELDRSDARFAGSPDGGGRLELVDAATAKAAWPALHERVRRERVGEVSAYPGSWDELDDAPADTEGSPQFVVHRGADGGIDGIAHFRVPWTADPNWLGTVQVDVLEAANRVAYAALWRLLCDLDLTRRVVAGRRPTDEPLRWMLANPRGLRVTRSADNLWLRILDVGAALAARGYAAAGTLVLAVGDAGVPANQAEWRLETGPEGADCRRVPGAAADLEMGVDALASVYLGGVAPAVLAAAGRIRELRSGAVRTLARLLQQDRAPFNQVGF